MPINLKLNFPNRRPWTILNYRKKKIPISLLVYDNYVTGTINGFLSKQSWKPNGNRSQWFKIDDAKDDAIKAKVGDIVAIDLVSFHHQKTGQSQFNSKG